MGVEEHHEYVVVDAIVNHNGLGSMGVRDPGEGDAIEWVAGMASSPRGVGF